MGLMECIFWIMMALFFISIVSEIFGRHTTGNEYHYFDSASEIANAAHRCDTYAGAKKQLDKLNDLMDTAEISGESDRTISCIDFERKDVQELVDSMERAEWEEKADKILSNFLDAFEFVTTSEYHTFRNIEDVLSEKKKCVRLWYKYWESIEGVQVRVHPKEYMKEYLGASFDPCMQESEKLKKRLEKSVENLKPENKRKKMLYDEIIKTVAESGSIMQCQLLKLDFHGATRKEVECCYNHLIAKYRLVKVKIGNRYFVSLSDKEKEKYEKKHST